MSEPSSQRSPSPPAPEDLARDLPEMLARAEAASAYCVSLLGGAPPEADDLMAALRRAIAAEAERDKLQAFKTWVHQYLDQHGVPHHPPGTHGAAGCRIGDRMDWLMAELAYANALASRNGAQAETFCRIIEEMTANGRAELDGLKREIERLRAQLTPLLLANPGDQALSRELHAQSPQYAGEPESVEEGMGRDQP